MKGFLGIVAILVLLTVSTACQESATGLSDGTSGIGLADPPGPGDPKCSPGKNSNPQPGKKPGPCPGGK